MKALVFQDVGEITLDEVKDPCIEEKNDAIVRITMSAICGTDLHFIRGTVGPMKKGTILGHEAVGVVEEIGQGIKNLDKGDRVIIPSTVACGYCQLCKKGFFSQCDLSNPNGREAGTAFFGGPLSTGPLPGCQTEYVRVPFANHNLVKIPADISDEKAILLSDIFPTAYFGVDIANVKVGDVVVVLGCGAVGQLTIASCQLRGASKIYAIDNIPSRLALARNQGAECINFDEEDPIKFIKGSTDDNLADVVIDAVGTDAVAPSHGPAAKEAIKHITEFKQEVTKIAPKTNEQEDNWIPGNAPSYALRSSVELAGKCGVISIIGVYNPLKSNTFPIGRALNKNLKVVMGNCHHRAYIPYLLKLVQTNTIDPTKFITQREPLNNIVEAYKQFDKRESGWVKVAIRP